MTEPPPASIVAPGLIVDGLYRLLAPIGQGAMGSVWRAERLDWAAPVAIKLLHQDLGRSEDLARFEREVRLAATLRGPHVVQVLDHGIDGSTQCAFIVMELLEGEPLSRRIQRTKRLNSTETHQLVTHLVRALSRAHAAGVVHRDLKPDNIFIVDDDCDWAAKILDFGVARWSPAALRDALTRPGSLLGTPVYMSPEQIVGRADLDHRADLWSLCVIASECLTGSRPFDGANFGDLVDLLHDTSRHPLPSSLGPVPQGFDTWFAKGTHADIAQRFQSARELLKALDVVLHAPAAIDSPKATGQGLAPTTVLEPLNTVQPLQPAPRHTVRRLIAAGGLATAVGLLVLRLGCEPLRASAPDALETTILESAPAQATGLPKTTEPQRSEAPPPRGTDGTTPAVIAPGPETPQAQSPTGRIQAPPQGVEASSAGPEVPSKSTRRPSRARHPIRNQPTRNRIDTPTPDNSGQVEVLGRKVRTTLD